MVEIHLLPILQQFQQKNKNTVKGAVAASNWTSLFPQSVYVTSTSPCGHLCHSRQGSPREHSHYYYETSFLHWQQYSVIHIQ